jgi:hypothetical protein
MLRHNPNCCLAAISPSKKRQRIEVNRHKLAVALLDILVPVQSGHPWRVVRSTEDQLYQQYLSLVHAFPNQAAISKSYFIKCVLDKKHTMFTMRTPLIVALFAKDVLNLDAKQPLHLQKQLSLLTLMSV